MIQRTAFLLATVVFLSISIVLPKSVLAKSKGNSLAGAETVLKMMNEKNSKTQTESKEISPTQKLRDDINTFSNNSKSMSAKTAAMKWLALVKRFSNMGFQLEFIGRPITAEELFKALPPPSSWPYMIRPLEKEKPNNKKERANNLALQLIINTLIGNDQKLKSSFLKIQKMASDSAGEDVHNWRYVSHQLNDAYIKFMSDPELIMKDLEQKITSLNDPLASPSLHLPDLVELVGQNRASAFLHKALTTTRIQLSIPHHSKTYSLAQNIALEKIDQLLIPQWDLTADMNGGPLYEALSKKFSKAKPDLTAGDHTLSMPALNSISEHLRMPADQYQVGRLLLTGETMAAKKLILETPRGPYIDGESLNQILRGDKKKDVYNLINEILDKNPEFDLWNFFKSIALATNREKEFISRAEKAIKKTSGAAKRIIEIELQSIYFESGQTDKAVAELRRKLKAPIKKDSENPSEELARLSNASELVSLGVLKNRTEWINEGVKAFKSIYEKNPTTAIKDEASRIAPTIADHLQKIGETKEAESLLIQALRFALENEIKNQYSETQVYSNLSGPLIYLTQFYASENRPSDVKKLLDEAPYWGASDIIDIQFSSQFQIHVASALASLGDKDTAHKIIRHLLNYDNGNDDAYELLLSLEGEKALDTLEMLFKRDQFEERPLIWKAVLLKKSGKLEEAEKSIRQAISLDPSDGEQTHGHRILAYDVLANILEARGNTDEAEKYRNAVKAIRLTEKADNLRNVDLLQDAIPLYNESLNIFVDAYCTHARLALSYASVGEFDRAVSHYQRSYELMPQSFGRFETYCFGCQGIFESEQAQSIAEDVFLKMLKTSPNKAQVHYLLGVLRNEQGRYNETYENFRAAVNLDPDYLRAWEKLNDLKNHVSMPREFKNEIQLNILRLDPFGKHTFIQASSVTDLKELWSTLEKAQALIPSESESLYPLEASKKRIQKILEDPRAQQAAEDMTYYREMNQLSKKLNPGSMIYTHELIRTSTEMLTPYFLASPY